MTLPEGWACPRLAEVAEFNPKHADDADRDQTVSFVPMPAVDEFLGAITAPVDRAMKEIWTGYTHFADGDVIFAKITPCMENGKAAVVSGMTNGLACGSTEFFVLRPVGGAAPSYIWRYLRQPSFRADAEQNMSGAVGQRRVPRPYLENCQIPLAPVAEQRRIVAKLDALTARVARARMELDRIPMLAASLRANILNRVFSGHQSAISLRDLTMFVTSGSRGWAKYYSDDGPTFVRVGDVRRRNIQLDLNEVQKVSPPDGAEGARTSLLPGDVVITITADLGRVGVVSASLGPGFVNQHVALARPKDRNKSEWIGWYLSCDAGQQQMLAKDRGVTKAGLGLDDIRNVEVPMPPEAVRAQGLGLIKAAFARADRLEAEAARARTLIDRLESAILARAFRGELVPQDPNDEPASVLLDRIRAQRAAAPKPRRGRRAASADAA